MNENVLQPPSLDTWTVSFLLAAGQGIFFAFALFFQKNDNRLANRLLGFYTLAFALSLIDYVGFWTRYNVYFPSISGFYEYLVFVFGPLLWLYFRAVLGQTIKKNHWLHLLAPLAYLGLKLAEWWSWFGSPQEFVQVQAFLMILHLSIYSVKSWLLLRSQILASNINSVQARWCRILLALYVCFILGWLVYFLVVNTPIFSLLLDYSIAFAMTLFIYTAAYLGYRRPEIFEGIDHPHVFQTEKYQHSTLTPAAADSLMKKIEETLHGNKLYLNNELRLAVFAKMIGASTHHVSQVINMKSGKSFPDYVNTFRFEYAKALLTSTNTESMKVGDAMYTAGFNNKTTFNRIFKEQTGMTPSEYKSANSK